MNIYKDPPNVSNILDKLKSCPTLGDIYNLVISTYPTWIIEFIDNYSYDYPHLRANWVQTAKDYNIKPAKIMIVDFLGINSDYSLIQHFAEVYTICGFLVRSKDEIEVCNFCNRAIPGKAQYDQMVSLKLPVPEVWSATCSTCVNTDK